MALAGEWIVSEPREWTDLQRRHMAWCAIPKGARKAHGYPKTKTWWAKKLGVDRHTLTRWEKLDGFWEEVHQLLGRYLLSELPDILGALAETAKASHTGPSVSAQRLILEHVGDIAPEGSASVNVTIFTKEDVQAAKAELAEWEREHAPDEDGTA